MVLRSGTARMPVSRAKALALLLGAAEAGDDRQGLGFRPPRGPDLGPAPQPDDPDFDFLCFHSGPFLCLFSRFKLLKNRDKSWYRITV